MICSLWLIGCNKDNFKKASEPNMFGIRDRNVFTDFGLFERRAFSNTKVFASVR